jgi:hypothetical protein
MGIGETLIPDSGWDVPHIRCGLISGGMREWSTDVALVGY